MGEQILCRRPTILLHVSPQEGVDADPPFAPDCFAFDLPIELTYGSDATNAPLYHMPEPSDAIVRLLVAAIALAEVKDCVEEHDDPRGLLFFDRGVTESIQDGPLDYAAATARIESAGFWLRTPTSAAELVAEIHACFPPEVAERAASARARYPVQYATDARWLEGLWRFVAAYVRQH